MMINIKKNIYKIMMAVMTAFVAVVSVLPICTYADDLVDTSTEYVADQADSDNSDTSFSDSKHPGTDYKFLCDATGYNSSWKQYEYNKCLYLKGGNMENVCAFISPNKPNTYEERYVFITSLSSASWYKSNWINWINNSRDKWVRSGGSESGESSFEDCSSISLNCYLFSSEEKAKAYLRGEIDASESENFDDVAPEGYDKDIPVPDVFEIKYLDASTVDAAFSYTNDSELSSFGHELKYEIVPDYVYATSSFTKAIVGGTALGATGNAAKLCAYIRSTVSGGVMQLPVTVEAYIADPKNNKDKLYTQANKTPVTGAVTASNLCSLSPPDYSSQYVANPAFGAFWGGAMNMNKAVFVGAQLSLRVYYTDSSGAKVYSNKVVVRYFSNDIINQLIGKKKTVVAKDDKGEDIVIDEGDTDPTTPVTPGDLTNINLVTYVKEIVGSITSYVALMQSVLAQCPASIWGLITAALAVSLAIIVVKILRGM